MKDNTEEFILKKGDLLYFTDGSSAQVVDIKLPYYHLRPFLADQDLGSGKGAVHPFKLEEIPDVHVYGGIKRPYYGV